MEPSPEDPLPTMLLLAITEMPIYFYAGIGIVLLVLLFMSGLVSGAEVSFFTVNTEDWEKPDEKEAQIVTLMAEPRRVLATILILNNLINVSIVTVSSYAMWRVVTDPELRGEAITILSAAITIMIVFFGEIIPKVLASNRPQQFARLSVSFIHFFSKILAPLSWLLLNLSQLVERRISQKGYAVSVDQLNQALEITAENNATQEEKGILKGIVNFGTLSVRQVMRSRMDISAIDVEADFHELMNLVNKNGFSRIPVYRESIDKIEGILYIKDLLPYLQEDESFGWQKLLRSVFFVPESKKIDDLFRDFQKKQVHMAIVVDEYGGTEGLITMEDIIEEIVGEINDEFDEDEDNLMFKKLDDRTFVFEGKTSLNDVCKQMNVDATIFDDVKGESESLGGLLLEINARLPKSGEKISFREFEFHILAVDQRRIKRVKIVIMQDGKEVGGNNED